MAPHPSIAAAAPAAGADGPAAHPLVDADSDETDAVLHAVALRLRVLAGGAGTPASSPPVDWSSSGGSSASDAPSSPSSSPPDTPTAHPLPGAAKQQLPAGGGAAAGGGGAAGAESRGHSRKPSLTVVIPDDPHLPAAPSPEGTFHSAGSRPGSSSSSSGSSGRASAAAPSSTDASSLQALPTPSVEGRSCVRVLHDHSGPLTVAKGEVLLVLGLHGEWLQCLNIFGQAGMVPAAVVTEAAPHLAPQFAAPLARYLAATTPSSMASAASRTAPSSGPATGRLTPPSSATPSAWPPSGSPAPWDLMAAAFPDEDDDAGHAGIGSPPVSAMEDGLGYDLPPHTHSAAAAPPLPTAADLERPGSGGFGGFPAAPSAAPALPLAFPAGGPHLLQQRSLSPPPEPTEPPPAAVVTASMDEPPAVAPAPPQEPQPSGTAGGGSGAATPGGSSRSSLERQRAAQMRRRVVARHSRSMSFAGWDPTEHQSAVLQWVCDCGPLRVEVVERARLAVVRGAQLAAYAVEGRVLLRCLGRGRGPRGVEPLGLLLPDAALQHDGKYLLEVELEASREGQVAAVAAAAGLVAARSPDTPRQLRAGLLRLLQTGDAVRRIASPEGFTLARYHVAGRHAGPPPLTAGVQWERIGAETVVRVWVDVPADAEQAASDISVALKGLPQLLLDGAGAPHGSSQPRAHYSRKEHAFHWHIPSLAPGAPRQQLRLVVQEAAAPPAKGGSRGAAAALEDVRVEVGFVVHGGCASGVVAAVQLACPGASEGDLPPEDTLSLHRSLAGEVIATTASAGPSEAWASADDSALPPGVLAAGKHRRVGELTWLPQPRLYGPPAAANGQAPA